jgi:hypothetical protein
MIFHSQQEPHWVKLNYELTKSALPSDKSGNVAKKGAVLSGVWMLLEPHSALEWTDMAAWSALAQRYGDFQPLNMIIRQAFLSLFASPGFLFIMCWRCDPLLLKSPSTLECRIALYLGYLFVS